MKKKKIEKIIYSENVTNKKETKKRNKKEFNLIIVMPIGQNIYTILTSIGC